MEPNTNPFEMDDVEMEPTVRPTEIPEEILEPLRQVALPTDNGEYTVKDIEAVKLWLADQKLDRGFRRKMKNFFSGIYDVGAWIARTPRRAMNNAIKAFVDYSSPTGGLLFRALDTLGEWQEALEHTFDKGVAAFVTDMVFDATCLAAHLATSDWRGKIFSLVEFVWRQFGPILKKPITEVWQTYVWPLISKLLGKNVRSPDGARADAMDVESTGTALATSAAVVGCLIAGKKVVDNRGVSSLVTSWGNLGRDVSNVQRGSTTIVNLCSKFVEWVKDAILYFWPGAKLGLGVDGEFKKVGINISDFIDLHKEFADLTARKQKATDFHTFPKLVEATRLGSQITHAIVSNKVTISASVRSELMLMRKDITEAVKYFEKYTISPPNRRCPMHIQFVGEPGCGKSELMTRVAMEIPMLCTEFGNGKVTPEGEEDFTFHDDGTPKVWTKGGGCKHDDGYNSELKVMTWDDVFAGKGTGLDESDGVWLIRTVSSMACPLSMADISDKGMEFRSLLMVTSTNEAYPKFTELRNDIAVWRRRNILIEAEKCGKLNVLVPAPAVSPAAPYAPIRSFANLDEALPWLAKQTYDFLQLPLLGGTRLTLNARKAMVEAMHADAYDEPVQRHFWEEVPHVVAPPAGALEVVDIEEAVEQNARGGDHARRCPCCAGAFCQLGQPEEDSWRQCCMEIGETEFDPVLEAELIATNMWICHRRGVLYYGDYTEGIRANPTTILGKMNDGILNFDTITRRMLMIPGEFNDMLHEMSYLMPNEIRQHFIEGTDVAAVWNWSVDIRIENWVAFFGAGSAEDLPDYDHVLRADNQDEEVEPENAREKLDRWHDNRWNGFCNFVHAAYQWCENKTAAGWAKMKEHCAFFSTLNIQLLCNFLSLGCYIFLLSLTIMCAMGLANKTLVTLTGAADFFYADAHNGPSGGDARTARLARMRLYKARSDALDVAITQFTTHMTKEGFPEVADKMEEMLRKKAAKLDASAEYDTLSERFLEKNMVLFEHEEEGRMKVIQGLALKGNLVLTLWHYARRFAKEEREVTFTYRAQKFEVRIGPNDIMRCKNLDGTFSPDLAIIAMDAKVGQFQDIVSKRHFVLEEEHQELDGMTTEMPSRRSDDRNVPYLHHFKVRQQTKVKYSETVTINGRSQEVDYVLPVAYTYGIEAKAGFCGAPLVKTGAITHGSIFGMHVAKDTRGMSSAIPLSEELVAYNVQRATAELRANLFDDTPDWYDGVVLGTPTQEFSEYNVLDKTLTVYPEGNMQYVATLKPGWVERVCNKTDIIPSPIQGVFPIVTQPSVKSKHDPRLSEDRRNDPDYTPLNEGAKKYAVPTKPFNRRALELATRFFISVLSMIRPVGGAARKLTLSEAINGVPAWGYTRLNMLTSAGWPHKRLRNPNFGTKGKRFLFEATNNEQDPEKITYKIRDPQLQKDVDEYQDNLNQKKRTFTVTYSNLKDERRGLAKITNGATRLFDCMSLPNTLMVRKYFGHWVATMNAACTSGYAAVGIDPESPDWSALYRRLNRYNGRVIAGDYKEWDGRLDPDVMMRAVEGINAWYRVHGSEDYSPLDDIARQILIMDVIRTYTIYGNTVVYKDQGLPSGMAITADFNCANNFLYLLTAFYSLRPKGCEDGPEDMELSLYGDDHLVAPAERIQAWFNFNTLRSYFAKHGIVYTDAMKRGGDIPDTMALADEATFLKRMFSPHPEFPDRIRAPIEQQTIEELANWIRKTLRPEDALMGNLADVQRFAYHHGRLYYQKTVDRVNNALQALRGRTNEELRIHLLKEDFEEMDERWLAKF